MSEGQGTYKIRSCKRAVSTPNLTRDDASLNLEAAKRLSSNSMVAASPSDMTWPSPVTSTGTEIDHDEPDQVQQAHANELQESELLALTTTLPETVRRPSDEEASSVVHAPESFSEWSSAAHRSDHKPQGCASDTESQERSSSSPPLQRVMSASIHWTQHHGHGSQGETDTRDSRGLAAAKLTDRQEENANQESQVNMQHPDEAELGQETAALQTALHEAWHLCNTLFDLSSQSRGRLFGSSSTPASHERTWMRCWELCRQLYTNQSHDAASLNVQTNLDLCRDFCQALFDVRKRRDEAADSVLRLSFDLNNHLYSAQGSGSLPEPFRERTLDFYVALCHRLMKQPNQLADEADQLLQACWGLIKALFGLRQSRRDGRRVDDELLGTAVDACLELGDIFRFGWMQMRSSRRSALFFGRESGQPPGPSRQSSRASRPAKGDQTGAASRLRAAVPETPVTEFEDTPLSPESRSPRVPNIMVLGTNVASTSATAPPPPRWASNASSMSARSHTSNRSSSTATTSTATEDPSVALSRILVVRAAMNLGFDRDQADTAALHDFVQALPPGCFGPLPDHATLLQQYKNSLLVDAFLPRNHALPSRGKRAAAPDVARSVQTMCSSSPRYSYLYHLFQFVFHFSPDEAEGRRSVITV
ncbi:hypothetical protein CDD82_1593 [Ophiocordyceps australis]|uniref:DUF7624 domain-containing protein n=1 Tax=Ophiocordyceps australis TaxID=1399860 RepID=A0A2C5Y942_9HYPO|nr:hypothetical protein CDD82_1593 [Ophiocordyceps australis]